MPLIVTAAARTGVVLLFIAIGLRVLGKRQLAQMNVYDLAMIMALANAVQNAMTSGSGRLAVGMAAAGTLIGFGRLLCWIFVRHPVEESRWVGSPVILASDGRLFPDRMTRQGITVQELDAALRSHALESIEGARLVVLEVDGSLSVIPCETGGDSGRKKRG